jgi:hypothetical protein
MSAALAGLAGLRPADSMAFLCESFQLSLALTFIPCASGLVDAVEGPVRP